MRKIRLHLFLSLYLNNENANIYYYNWCFHLFAINSFKHFRT
jgi:hypothetical protein